MPNISNVVRAFRLRCYLSRSYEKHPLLLLEPLFSGPSSTERVQWYLYDDKGGCHVVELRRLQPLCLSQDKERHLLQELRGLKQAEGLGQLSDLWLANIKGIALRSLICGQLLATEGVWVVRERSFYALLTKTSTRMLEASEQPVELHTTGRNINGTLTVLDSFVLPDIPANIFTDLSLEKDWPKQLLICRLRLESAELLCMKAQNCISGLCFLPNYEATKNHETAELADVFLFAPTRSIDYYPALYRFLNERKRQFPSFLSHTLAQTVQPLEHFWGQSAIIFTFLQQLVVDYTGWGAYSGLIKDDKHNRWKRLGGWCLREELWQRAARHAYQRACQFGGYMKLETELANHFASVTPSIPMALVQSLLAYLCGKGSAPPKKGEIDFWASCVKVDDYILAVKALHPKIRKSESNADNSDNPTEKSSFPAHISPQGRRLLQSLYDAGQRGLSFAALRREEPVQALIRSGWAVLSGQTCYARNCAPKPSRNPVALVRSEAPVRDLTETLRYYKKKNREHKDFYKGSVFGSQRSARQKPAQNSRKKHSHRPFASHKPEQSQNNGQERANTKHNGPNKFDHYYQKNRNDPDIQSRARKLPE